VLQWTPMRVVAIVLAAGEGRRMGGPKALLPFDGGTFLSRACGLLARPGIAGVVAVLGAEAERVRSSAGIPAGATLTVNERWREGMLTSVWRGLDEAEALYADAVLLQPVDHPLVETETVRRVLDGLASGAAVVVPAQAGRRGHPGGFARSMFAELRGAPLARGARAVLEADAGRVLHVPGGPGCLAGIDTPADYARLVGPRPVRGPG
jgi:CTP:molybdopterin cytidylyltransferase MocA